MFFKEFRNYSLILGELMIIEILSFIDYNNREKGDNVLGKIRVRVKKGKISSARKCAKKENVKGVWRAWSSRGRGKKQQLIQINDDIIFQRKIRGKFIYSRIFCPTFYKLYQFMITSSKKVTCTKFYFNLSLNWLDKIKRK